MMMWQAIVLGVTSGVAAACLCFALHFAFHKCACRSRKRTDSDGSEKTLRLQHQTCSRDTMVAESPDVEAQRSDSLSERGSAESYGSSDVTPENLSELTSLEEWEEDSEGSSGFFHGRLHVSIEYDSRDAELKVTANRAQISTAACDPEDFYVNVRVEENLDNELTPVCRAARDLAMREPLAITATYEGISSSQLRLSLYRRLASGIELEGWTVVSLACLPPDTIHTGWHYLKPNFSQQVCPHGMLQVSLCYLTSTESLSVMVVRACNLFSDAHTTPDAQVAAILRLGDRILRRKVTSTKSGTASPEWNEVLMFNVPFELLGQLELQLVVVDTDLLAHEQLLGRTCLGGHLEGTPGTHWRLMMQQPTSPVAMWHFLSMP